MLFLFTLLSLLALVVAAPTITRSATRSSSTVCHAKVFDKPWTLRDITIYKAAGQDSNGTHAAISFQFCDENDGLQLTTDCSGTVINDRCEGDDGGYVLCADETVGFKLAYDLIMMERGFIDDCLGPAPWNSGRAFGENNTDMNSASETSGTLWSQNEMLVHITAQT